MTQLDKTALVCGAGGFIGHHMVKRLKAEGFVVCGVDLKLPEFGASLADEFIIGDLRDPVLCHALLGRPFEHVYQFAADMGGAGYIFTGDNDAAVVHNSATINLNMLEACRLGQVGRVFFASSACVYPARNQQDTNHPDCTEDSAYPADPDSAYGWEKLFSERAYLAYARNHGLQVRIARYHNIFGPEGTWRGGREKAPAAVCRKVAQANDGESIEIWGDGQQTRSFLLIDECVEGSWRLMCSDFAGPVNIGSEELIAINDLARMTMRLAGKTLQLVHVPGPTGVRGRRSHNQLIRERLGWAPSLPLEVGMARTYAWIAQQVRQEVGS